jgi:hypothetical protein
MPLRDELLALFPALRNLPLGAYVVGGAVRDLLRGAPPADVDVACLDAAACAETLGRKVIRLGREEHISAWRVVDGEHVYDFAALLDGTIDADLGRRAWCAWSTPRISTTTRCGCSRPSAWPSASASRSTTPRSRPSARAPPRSSAWPPSAWRTSCR